MQQPHRGVKRNDDRNVMESAGENVSGQNLLEMLGALRRPIDQQNGSRGRNDVDDPDQRLLRHARGPRPREGQQHGRKQGEGKRIAIGGRTLGGMAEHECHRRAERRDLRERQIDKDDFAGEDLDAEIGVDADQAYRHQERGPKECEGFGHRAANADSSAATLVSNSEM